MIGNTNKAEQLTSNWAQNFGLYAIDGTMWVHPADNPLEVWEQKIFHRPKNIYEYLVFQENPEVWKSTERGCYHVILPLPWRKLTIDQLAKVEFIITYFTGDTKIYLKSEVSTEEAKELFEWVLNSN